MAYLIIRHVSLMSFTAIARWHGQFAKRLQWSPGFHQARERLGTLLAGNATPCIDSARSDGENLVSVSQLYC